MNLSVQFLSLLAMIGTGIVSGAFIDMIGTGTGHARKKSFIRRNSIFFEIIGWIIAGCWAFYILYVVRDGAWRIYDPFAQMSGILLYASLFHKPFRYFGRLILVLFIKPLWFIAHFIVSIIRQLIRFIVKVIMFFLTPFLSLFRKLYRKDFKSRKK